MKQWPELFSIFMLTAVHLIGSADSSPEIIIRTIENGTSFALQLYDRQAQSYTSTMMSPDSVTTYDYAIGKNKDVIVDDLLSTNMYVKTNYFCHHARFKIAMFDSDGRRKEGKSNYAHIGVTSDIADATQAVITLRYGHLYTNTIHSHSLQLSRCQNCNVGRVVEINCVDCKKICESLVASQSIAVDIVLQMNAQEIENDTGRISCGYRIRQNKN